jgi:hypothetical protein
MNQKLYLKAEPPFNRYLLVLLYLCLLSGFNLQAQVLWSDNSSWTSFGATKPVAGSAVTIPEGVNMILDVSPPSLASLSIMGKVEFANKDLNLTAGWIMVHGTLQVGSVTTPYANKAVITLNGADPNESIMDMGTRGIMVMGGKLELHGTPPTKTRTKLNDNAAAGTTTINLLDQVSWKVNDQVVIATSDYYGAANGTAQRTQITAVNGSSLTIQDGLNAQRWGKLQYLTPAGMSLSYQARPANLPSGTPTVLDERAEIANLTRNIVVQSVEDDLWRNNGFGCHIMIMRMGSMVGEAHLNGVEIRRGGQAGKLGRYPFHWHMLSYDGSTTLPDVTGQYIRNSTVNQSANRGIVIHGTNGAEVSNNVVYDVLGHAVFTENASERRNIIDGNLVLKVRDPLPQNALKVHETYKDRGSSGFWISNPDNTVTNNIAADCGGVGFWLAFPKKTFGASSEIALNPSLLKFGTFKNNHAHSNQMEGIFLDNAEVDELGNTGGSRYNSTIDMKDPQWPWSNILEYELADYTVWKNNRNGIWNRSSAVRNLRVVNADNSDRFFAGAINDAVPASIEKSLVVGTSLNYDMNGVKIPAQFGSGPLAAFASYHSSVEIKDNVIVNFPADPGKPSGYIALNDYYLIPVDKGNTRNTGNILINTHPGVRTKPIYDQHVFGVLWDNHNYLGVEASQDNYYVFDEPFFTYGQTRHIVAPNPEVSGGVVVRGPFYGFYNYYINGIERKYEKIKVIRTDAAGTTVGNWVVEAGAPGDILGNMRHFAAHPTGYYYLDFPTIDEVNDFSIRVSNMLTANDYQVVSVEYSGKYNITKFFVTAPGLPQTPYTAVADFQSVVNAPTGQVYWQDRANNKVWMKVRGGVNPGDLTLAATKDLNLYKEFNINASGSLAPLTADAQPPTTPDNIAGSNITSSSVTISWNASTDDVGVTGYEVFLGTSTTPIATTTSTSATITGLSASTSHSFTVKARDAAGNRSAASAAKVITTTTGSTSSNYVAMDVWTGIQGRAISDIPLGNAANSTVNLTTLESTATGDDYGVRIRGYIVPSVTNTYYFYIASDDNGDFYLSSNDQPSNKGNAISRVLNWTNSREWTKDVSTQKSAGKLLQAGTRYYFEALMKEASGGDKLAIGWTTATDNTGISVIGGTNIEPYQAASVSKDRTDPVGAGTITARGQIHAGEGSDKAFDNDFTASKWLDQVATNTWIQYTFSNSGRYAVDKYTITSGNDISGRDPKTWRLLGSNVANPAAGDFTEVDSRTNYSFTERNQKNDFNPKSTGTAYSTYRLEIISNNGDQYTQLSEIELFAPDNGSAPGGSVTSTLLTGGTGYTWGNMTGRASIATQYSSPEVTNSDVTDEKVVADNNTTDQWQAAGIIYSTVKSGITKVEYFNGSQVNDGYDNGSFTADIGLQYTANGGSSWIEASGWTVAPAYPYSYLAANQTYTFTGPALPSTTNGVRVVGKVNSNGNVSWAIHVRELKVYATGTSTAASVKDQYQLQLNQNTVAEKITVFPNPVTDGWLTLGLTAADKNNKVDVSLADLSGRIVYKSNFISNGISERFNIGDIQAGIYVIRVTGSNTKFSAKVIVQ